MKYSKKLGAVRAARKLTIIDEASIRFLANVKVPLATMNEARSTHEVVQRASDIGPSHLKRFKKAFTGEQA